MTWRAVYCKSGAEIAIAKELSLFGIDALCLYERFKRHTKVAGTTQVRWVNIPVFRNYIFGQVDGVSNLKLIKGVIGVVSSSSRALSIPDRVISQLRLLGDENGLVRQADLTKNSSHFTAAVGDKFAFHSRSPLRGLIGQILSLAKLDETGEIVAWVEAFGRTTEVSLQYSEVSEVFSQEPVAKVA